MTGFNLCFFPMHFLGLQGLPRRMCRFDFSFSWLNTVASLGAIISVCSSFFFCFIVWESLVVGNRVVGM